jgi:uncharacterized membrane protein
MKNTSRLSWLTAGLLVFVPTMLTFMVVMVRFHLFAERVDLIIMQVGAGAFFLWGLVCGIRLALWFFRRFF